MKTIIAGGGIGGLVTALYLSHYQEDVLLLEKKSLLGGRIRFVEEAGFKIDEGPTIVLLPEVILSILEEAGVDRKRFR
ncbi:NAD(P)-binding protein [Sinobaca sp. H24]|uniref:NAD(P)-binding protein n=1 Tax=Sinobaca sp. H24 TaxID=2923376 RepID=UPI0027E38858|nr:NAD(P)-binding protein [Sinobaca sp. H24]